MENNFSADCYFPQLVGLFLHIGKISFVFFQVLQKTIFLRKGDHFSALAKHALKSLVGGCSNCIVFLA